MKTYSIVATLSICLNVFSAEFTPRMPTCGDPFLLSLKEYPVDFWRSKSETNFPWFVTKNNGWYIDWDCERKEIAYLVIHHTAGPENESSESISETIRKRLYEPVYRDQTYKTPYVYGLPTHPGHMVDGKETFTAYHYLIYPDGTLLTTLFPYRKVGNTHLVEMIGWGAGNWKINCASIQIALVGTWSKERPPTKEALAVLKDLTVYYTNLIPKIKIVGHYEVRPKPTECPGDWWLEWVKTIR